MATPIRFPAGELDVIVDMTALDTPSRHRGIGRYVTGLCGAFRNMGERRGLHIAGLTRHRGSAVAAVDPTFTFAGDPGKEITSMGYQRHKMGRRLSLGTLARRTGARLLHLPDPPGTPIDMRIPRIISCHDLIPLILHRQYLKLPGQRMLQWLRDLARYRTAHRVIASSHSTKHDVIERLGIAPELIDVVHLAVDHERFNTVRIPDEERRVRELLGFDGPFIVYVGAADARKGVDLLIRAYARSRLSPTVPLVIAGPLSAKQTDRFRALALQEGVANDVRLHGYVDDDLVTALYRTCLMHVFASAYEGFGLTVLEAMACGAPTITTRTSSLGEVAADAALTLETRTVPALTAAMDELSVDSALQADLRQRGLVHAKTFTWERCASETLDCYLRALA